MTVRCVGRAQLKLCLKLTSAADHDSIHFGMALVSVKCRAARIFKGKFLGELTQSLESTLR